MGYYIGTNQLGSPECINAMTEKSKFCCFSKRERIFAESVLVKLKAEVPSTSSNAEQKSKR